MHALQISNELLTISNDLFILLIHKIKDLLINNLLLFILSIICSLGVLLFSSHDHELINTVANRIIYIGEDKANEMIEYIEK